MKMVLTWKQTAYGSSAGGYDHQWVSLAYIAKLGTRHLNDQSQND